MSASLCVDASGHIADWAATKSNSVAPGKAVTGSANIVVISNSTSDLNLLLGTDWRLPDGTHVDGAAILHWTTAGGWVQVTSSRQMYH